MCNDDDSDDVDDVDVVDHGVFSKSHLQIIQRVNTLTGDTNYDQLSLTDLYSPSHGPSSSMPDQAPDQWLFISVRRQTIIIQPIQIFKDCHFQTSDIQRLSFPNFLIISSGNLFLNFVFDTMSQALSPRKFHFWTADVKTLSPANFVKGFHVKLSLLSRVL